jgi:Recombinase zinc beta ribbon domain
VVDPGDGRQVWRAKGAEALVEVAVPELRIADDGLWGRAQARLAAEALPTAAPRGTRPYWDRRLPHHLLTGKVVCGACGRGFSVLGQDYLGCRAARNRGGCRNARRVRRTVLEARVLEALGARLMRPELAAEFCAAFAAEWNRLAAEASAGAEARARELRGVERKIGNLIDAVAGGLKAPGVRKRLEELEARRGELRAGLDGRPAAAPALHPDLARLYAERVAELRRGLEAEDGAEALEAARALVDRVVVSPGPDPDGGPEIELIGELMAMLRAGGALRTPEDASAAPRVLAALGSSAKGGAGGVSLPQRFLNLQARGGAAAQGFRTPPPGGGAPGGRAACTIISSPTASVVTSPTSRPPASVTPTAGACARCSASIASERHCRDPTSGTSRRITSSTGASRPRSCSARIMSSRVSTPRSAPAPSTTGNSRCVVSISSRTASSTRAEGGRLSNRVTMAAETGMPRPASRICTACASLAAPR